MVAIVWLCFVVRGVFYASLLPLWEGYDEYSHFAYIQYLTTHGAIPIPAQSRNSLEVGASLTQSPMPWTARGVPGAMTYDAFWQLPTAQRALRTAPLRAPADAAARAEDPRGEPIYESQQPPFYYWLMAPLLRAAESWSLAARVFLLRCAAVLLCSLALPLGFALARRVLASGALAIGVIATVACMPEAMIDIARVGNESLALLVYTALLYACVRLLDEGPGLRSCLLIGVLLGCGLLTKAYFLTAIPAVCIAFALAPRRNPGWVAASLAIAAAIAGWWYRFIHAATGDFTGQIQSVAIKSVPLAERLRVALRLDWLRAIDMALFSHIWFGGWSFLQVRSWIYHLFYAVALAALIGLTLLVLRRRATKAMWLLAGFEALFCASLAYQVTIAQIAYRKPMTNGWYLYCLVFAEIILICAGLMALLPPRHRVWAPLGLTGLFALLDLYGMNFVLIPYYLGLIAHTPDGRLPAFHAAQLWQTGLPEIGSRVILNSPYLASPIEFSALWLLYLAATLACLWIVVCGRGLGADGA